MKMRELTEMKAFELEEMWVVAKQIYRGHFPEITHIAKEYPTLKARLAIQLVERFGMIVADTVGEDSAGRSKMVAMPPQEVVDRALKIADLLVDSMRTLGWMETMPTFDELQEESD